MAFPIIASYVTSATAANATTRTITTTGLGNGDLGLAFLFGDGNSTYTWPSPWVELADANISTVASMTIGYVAATAAISSVNVTASLSERSTHIFARITGHHTTTAPAISAGATGASTTPNPDSLNPAGWDVEDTLWIAVYGVDSGNVTAYPLPDNNQASPTTTSAAYGAVCSDELAQASLDPGTFTNSISDDWRAYTIAIRPAPAGGGSSLDRTTTDAVTFADAVTRVVVLLRTTSDSQGQSDAAVRAVVLGRTAGDAVTNADAATRIVQLLRSADDAAGLSDVAVASKTYVRTVADAITQSDAVTRSVVLARSLADAVTQSDVATRAVALLRSATDGATYSDAVTQTKTLLRTTADALASSDAATRAVVLARTISDAVAHADAAVREIVGGGGSVIGSAALQFIERMSAALSRVVSHAATLSLQARHEADLVTAALEYDLNDSTVPTCTFTVNGTPTDPATISLFVREPDGTTTTYTYAAAQITKDSTGVFSKSISLNKRGVWYFKYTGTGACEAVAEGTVTVNA